MAKFKIIDAHDASGKQVAHTVVDLPDEYQDGDRAPSPQSSDSTFPTLQEAEEELQQRIGGKGKCACGCGMYPKAASSRFLPGHDLKKAYQDRR